MIDFSKPIELEDGTPVTVTGRTYEFREYGTGYEVEMPGERDNIYYTVKGTAPYLPDEPRIRNRALVDWSQPIELEDGTPAEVAFGPDNEGDCKVASTWGDFTGALWVRADGSVIGMPDELKVRNRKPEDRVTVSITRAKYEALKTLGVL